MEERYHEVITYGLATTDRKHLLNHLGGEKLTPMQAIHAKCYECSGYYADGKADCGISTCPLYPYHRYNSERITRIRNITPEVRENLRKQVRAFQKG